MSFRRLPGYAEFRAQGPAAEVFRRPDIDASKLAARIAPPSNQAHAAKIEWRADPISMEIFVCSIALIRWLGLSTRRFAIFGIKTGHDG